MLARLRSAADAARPLLTSEALGQLVRFALAGLGVTMVSTLIYLSVSVMLGVEPLIANTVSYLVGVTIGYAVHSHWSFRAAGGDHRRMAMRFLLASGAAFALNSLWVWLATRVMHLPAWTPASAMMFVTPLGSFALNRYWVFA